MAVDMIPRLISISLCAAAFLGGCSGEPTPNNKYAGDMVLALSWQPGFCETRPRLRECRSQTSDRYDARYFSLHGLWPQPRNQLYCGVGEATIEIDKSRRWRKLAGLGLSDALKKKLWKVMPGTRSFLHRHEWVKHGTCYSDNAETYFLDSVKLLDDINNSGIRDLFHRSLGRELSNKTIRSAFDQAFGKGVGERVRVSCKRDGSRMVITEITLGLSGAVDATATIGDLARASPKTKRGCPVGIVDPAGFQ